MVILGLVLMSLLVMPLVSLGALFGVAGTMYIGSVLVLVVLGAWVIFLDVLRRRCAEKQNISTVKFLLAAELPALIEGALAFGVVEYLSYIGYFRGFLAGLMEFFWSISLLICSAIVLAGHMLLCGVRHMLEKKKKCS